MEQLQFIALDQMASNSLEDIAALFSNHTRYLVDRHLLMSQCQHRQQAASANDCYPQ